MIIEFQNEQLAKLYGKKVGDIMVIDCRQGVPINREWRNRIKDSKIDGCIKIIEQGGE